MEPTSRPQRGYRGSKAGAGVCQKLINLMPPHTVYVEPYLGHGAVLLQKRPARLSIGLDLDAQAVQEVRARLWHRQCGASCSVYGSGDEAGVHNVSDETAGTHNLSDDDAGLDNFCDDDAAALRTHRQSAYFCRTFISDDDAGVHDVSDDDRGTDIEIGTARYRLLVADALDFLRSYPFTGNELVYCDPPYVRSTRRSRGRLYRYEMDDFQHTALLTILRSLPCAVMVSGYRSALYDQMLEDWRSIAFQAQTRGGPAIEVVWMNYPQPTDLHEYTHLGQTFRERERQKRQQGRWIKKVAAKPLLEQKALLAGLLEGVGPFVSAEVLRSVLAQFGNEALIASNGTPAESRTMAMTAAPQRASRCTICRSPACQRIDQALAAGDSLREIAQREGLSKTVLGRHRLHASAHAVSHFESGTADPAHQQQSTLHSVQLELLSPETIGEDRLTTRDAFLISMQTGSRQAL